MDQKDAPLRLIDTMSFIICEKNCPPTILPTEFWIVEYCINWIVAFQMTPAMILNIVVKIENPAMILEKVHFVNYRIIIIDSFG